MGFKINISVVGTLICDKCGHTQGIFLDTKADRPQIDLTQKLPTKENWMFSYGTSEKFEVICEKCSEAHQ